MTFDPYGDYQNSKRKERNMQRALPFFLVFLLLALMGWAGYRGYKSVKPKPVAAEPVVIPYTHLSAATISCNDGVMVTDWRYCQENKTAKEAVLSGKKPSWAEDHACYRETLDANRNPVDTAIVCPEDEPRKHKRLYNYYPADKSWTRGPWDRWTIITTVPAQISCSKLSSASAGTCESRPLTPEEIDRYKPIAEKPAPTEWPLFKTCATDSETGCTPPPTTPQDITNLMEKIAPTPVANGLTWSTDGAYWCFAGTSCPVPSAADIEAHKPKKSDCKMPADIDVCPAQMLDPKVKP